MVVKQKLHMDCDENNEYLYIANYMILVLLLLLLLLKANQRLKTNYSIGGQRSESSGFLVLLLLYVLQL